MDAYFLLNSCDEWFASLNIHIDLFSCLILHFIFLSAFTWIFFWRKTYWIPFEWFYVNHNDFFKPSIFKCNLKLNTFFLRFFNIVGLRRNRKPISEGLLPYQRTWLVHNFACFAIHVLFYDFNWLKFFTNVVLSFLLIFFGYYFLQLIAFIS